MLCTLQADGSLLMRSLLQGCVRFTRNFYLKSMLAGLVIVNEHSTEPSMAHIAPGRIMEIGGGCGGDCAVWMASSHILQVDVVEPNQKTGSKCPPDGCDLISVQEYQRRLVFSFGGTSSGKNAVAVNEKCFQFHVSPILELPPNV